MIRTTTACCPAGPNVCAIRRAAPFGFAWPDGGFYKPHAMLFVENAPPQTGATFDKAGNITGYWGSEIHGGADTGGFPYSP